MAHIWCASGFDFKSGCDSQLGQQQTSSQQQPSHNTFCPPIPRGGRGGWSFDGRFNAPPWKPFCLFCGEDKGHTTRTYHHTVNKKKELASSATQPSQSKEVFSTSSYYSPCPVVCPTPIIGVEATFAFGLKCFKQSSDKHLDCIYLFCPGATSLWPSSCWSIKVPSPRFAQKG